MAIAHLDEFAAIATTTGPSFSASRTANASAKGLLVAVIVEADSPVVGVSTVTWNSVALVKDVDFNSGSSSNVCRATLWRWDHDANGALPTGAQTLAVTLSGSIDRQARCYGNTYDQELDLANTTGDEGQGSGATLASLGYSAPALIATTMVGHANPGTVTPAAGMTERQADLATGSAAGAYWDEIYTSGSADTPDVDWTTSTLHYAVVAASYNEAGVALPAPSTPTSLDATPFETRSGDSANTIDWDHDEDTSTFLLEYSTDGTNFFPVGIMLAGYRTHIHDGLNSALSYRYRIRAIGDNVNHTGASTVSSVVGPVTPANTVFLAHNVAGDGAVNSATVLQYVTSVPAGLGSIIVAVGAENNGVGTVSSVEWDPDSGAAQSLGSADIAKSSEAATPPVRAELWSLNNPTSGPGTLTVTMSGIHTRIFASVMECSAELGVPVTSSDSDPGGGSATAYSAISYTAPVLMVHYDVCERPILGLQLTTGEALFINEQQENTSRWLGAKHLTSGTSVTPGSSWRIADADDFASVTALYPIGAAAPTYIPQAMVIV